MSNTHTPEPWSFIECEDYVFEIDGQNGNICEVRSTNMTNDFDEANAKRIVECVNAMAGIENPVEFMEVVKKLELDAYHKMKAERDEIYVAVAVARNMMLKTGITVDNADTFNLLNKYVAKK